MGRTKVIQQFDGMATSQLLTDFVLGFAVLQSVLADWMTLAFVDDFQIARAVVPVIH